MIMMMLINSVKIILPLSYANTMVTIEMVTIETVTMVTVQKERYNDIIKYFLLTYMNNARYG